MKYTGVLILLIGWLCSGCGEDPQNFNTQMQQSLKNEMQSRQFFVDSINGNLANGRSAYIQGHTFYGANVVVLVDSRTVNLQQREEIVNAAENAWQQMECFEIVGKRGDDYEDYPDITDFISVNYAGRCR